MATVVQVKVHYDGEIRDLPMDEQEMLDNPTATLAHVMEAARDMTGVTTKTEVIYTTDKGDRRLFCASAVRDALRFCDTNGDASSRAGPFLLMLDLEVHVVSASPRSDANQQKSLVPVLPEEIYQADSLGRPLVGEQQKILVILLDEETGAQAAVLEISRHEWQNDAQLAHAMILSHLTHSLARGKIVNRITYMDDDGDKCSLVPASLMDALSFASVGKDESTLEMKFFYTVEDAQPSEPACIRDVSAILEDRLKQESALVEVHPRVECDGCHMYPIRGFRFKCATREDYDLCHECFLHRGEEHEGHKWVQVAGVPEPVGSSCDGEEVVTCDGCGLCPVLPTDRFKCKACDDYDLCRSCHARRQEIHPEHDNWIMPRTACVPQQLSQPGTTIAQGAALPAELAVTCDGCGLCPVAPANPFVVTCDGCGLCPVAPADRFKCRACPDYDLCGLCHAKRREIHPEHDAWYMPPTSSDVHGAQSRDAIDSAATSAQEILAEIVPAATVEEAVGGDAVGDAPLETVNATPVWMESLDVPGRNHPEALVRAEADKAWLQLRQLIEEKDFTLCVMIPKGESTASEADEQGLQEEHKEPEHQDSDVNTLPPDDTLSSSSDDEWFIVD